MVLRFLLLSFCSFSFFLQASSEGGSSTLTVDDTQLGTLRRAVQQEVRRAEGFRREELVSQTRSLLSAYERFGVERGKGILDGHALCQGVRQTFAEVFLVLAPLAYEGEVESLRALVASLVEHRDTSHEEERQRAIYERWESDRDQDNSRLVQLARELQVDDLLRVSFVATAERVFRELLAFSLTPSASKEPFTLAPKIARRNMVWMLRDQLSKVWKNPVAGDLAVTRVRLVLEAYRSEGVGASYALCDLTHERHVAAGTHARNTFGLFAWRLKDVTPESVSEHLRILPGARDRVEERADDSPEQRPHESPEEEVDDRPEGQIDQKVEDDESEYETPRTSEDEGEDE